MSLLYQALLSALISLLTSSVVTAYFSHKLSTSETKRELRRQKLEQLYVATIVFKNILFTQALGAAGYHNKRVNKETFSTMFKKDAERCGEAGNTMVMLSNLYFPNLVPFLNDILKHRDILGDAGIKTAAWGDAPDYNQGAAILTEWRNNEKLFKDFSSEMFKTGMEINK